MPLSRVGASSLAYVDLYWLPLGAGGHLVRLNGRVFEAFDAALHRRRPCDLYHSALEVRHGADRYVIEQGPVWNTTDPGRGVVFEGPVGSRWLGRNRLFRYEVRRWRGGVIPDVTEAVASPQRLSHDAVRAGRLLELVPEVPRATWGRDELGVGEMWNSNSLVSWLLALSGHDTDTLVPPPRGRAPGWGAGLAVAARQIQDHRTERGAPPTRALTVPSPRPRVRDGRRGRGLRPGASSRCRGLS